MKKSILTLVLFTIFTIAQTTQAQVTVAQTTQSQVTVAQTTQSQVFKKDDKFLSIGYGFGILVPDYGAAYVYQLGYSNYNIGPVSISFDRFLSDKISFGGYLGYYTSVATWSTASYPSLNNPSYENKYSFSGIQILLRGAYHYNLKALNIDAENLDVYFGFGLGYTGWSSKRESTDPNAFIYNIPLGSPVGFSGFVGTRYMFTEKIGGYVEAGYGLSAMQLGLTFKP